MISSREAGATKGVVFNVQGYSIQDGFGSRTTVFFKGCPLRCRWCKNPESQAIQPEVFFVSEKCTGCGKCVEAYPEAAIEICQERWMTNCELCRGHGKCAKVCPNGARNLTGRYIKASEVFKEVSRDAIFYQRSGGGVTLSGGEPLTQPEFALSVLQLCKDAALHAAIDTLGYAK